MDKNFQIWHVLKDKVHKHSGTLLNLNNVKFGGSAWVIMWDLNKMGKAKILRGQF